jgi:5-methylthioadenosine/S-adenosylhomocysteine deaminase
VGPDGRIVAAGPDDLVPRPPAVPEERLPGVALLPGLVNAHTHLELTGFDGLVPEADFPAWVRRVRTLKAERSAADFRAAARRGIVDCRAAGITTVADTGDSGAVIEALHASGGSGIAYQEVFGPDPGDAPARLAALQARVAELRPFTSPRVRLGVSPHAPYTVSGPLYAAVAAWCAAQSLPLAVHLAESREETQLLATRTGGFAEALAARGIPVPEGLGRTPVEWLELHGVLGARTLCTTWCRRTPPTSPAWAGTPAQWRIARAPIAATATAMPRSLSFSPPDSPSASAPTR